VRSLHQEILLSFWKIHILHHAAQGPIYGQGMLEELRGHGYRISPGTLYPLLDRMERSGWLRGKKDPSAGSRARRDYSLTAEGRRALKRIRRSLEELHEEVIHG